MITNSSDLNWKRTFYDLIYEILLRNYFYDNCEV